jgi:hypothetical protein
MRDLRFHVKDNTEALVQDLPPKLKILMRLFYEKYVDPIEYERPF